MSRRAEILLALADGALHSGAALARQLGVSRAAVAKQLARLRALGLEIEAVPGRGYRLPVPCRPLAAEAILRALGAAAASRWRRRIMVLERVDSTNRYLLARPLREAPRVCLAEAQTAGRGRRGRGWAATPYHNVLFSMSWRLEAGAAYASGLSLAAALAVARALEDIGVRGVGLKWPNDVLWQERKLAGVLVEVQGEAGGPAHVVIGVGINGYIGPAEAARIDQPWVDLYHITGTIPDRNRLVARLIVHLEAVLAGFAAGEGFAPFRAEWESRHLYTGRPVRLVQDGTSIEGIVEGVDEYGALRLRSLAAATAGSDVRRFFSGELSLRPA